MTPSQVPELLAAHLRYQLGAWPPTPDEVLVAGSARRTQPGWDGHVRSFSGMKTPTGTVLSVAPDLVGPITALLPLWGSADFDDALAAVLGQAGQGRRVVADDAIYRWSVAPTPTTPATSADVGEWVDRDDPRLPPWLHPFNGGILCAWDDRGNYGAGVGIKLHDEFGREISVGTEPALRGRGMARALVVTAARQILAVGAIPTYVHEVDNVASAHVAEASGFPDHGFRVIGFWPAWRETEAADAS